MPPGFISASMHGKNRDRALPPQRAAPLLSGQEAEFPGPLEQPSSPLCVESFLSSRLLIIERNTMHGEKGFQVIPLIAVEVVVEVIDLGSRHGNELLELRRRLTLE